MSGSDPGPRGSAHDADLTAAVGDLERWAATLETADPEAVPDGVVQRLLALVVRLYAAKLDLGQVLDPFPPGDVPTATAVGLAVGRMLKAADVELFELVMWQQLIDRPK